MACATGRWRVIHRSGRFIVGGHVDCMAAVAVATARRINQSGNQQRLAVLAGEIAADQVFGFIMTGPAISDLADGRHRRIEIFRGLNLVCIAMAGRARCGICMDAAACFTRRLAVALATGLPLVDSGDSPASVRPVELAMAVFAIDAFVSAGQGRLEIVTSVAVDVLSGCDSPEPLRNKEHKQAPHSGRMSMGQFHDYAPIGESMEFKYVLVARNTIGVFRNGCTYPVGIKDSLENALAARECALTPVVMSLSSMDNAMIGLLPAAVAQSLRIKNFQSQEVRR